MSIKSILVMDEEDAHARTLGKLTRERDDLKRRLEVMMDVQNRTSRDLLEASKEVDKAAKGLDLLARERDEARRVAAQLAYVLDSVRGRYASLENEAICDALALVPKGWGETGHSVSAEGEKARGK